LSAISVDPAKIDEIFAGVNQCHLPGAAVGIAVAGKPAYRKGFGLANMELPVTLAPTLRMRIASMTKHFTCLAYMLLCEQGRAALEDTVAQYLPELHPTTHPITMRQLMGHVSGLRCSHDVSNHFSGTGRHVSSADLLRFYHDVDDVNFPPDTAWSYNNGGYLILSTVIERITGQSLEQVFRERIFEPAGMHDTLLRRFDTDFVPNSATLHMTNGSGGFEKSYIGTASAGEGGIVSTVDDLLRWLAHMDAPVIGSVSTWELMKKPMTLANGTSTGYGMGLMSTPYRGVETLAHSGSLMGCNSYMIKVPAAALDVVVLVNRHDVIGILLANRILDVCVPGLQPLREPFRGPFSRGLFRSPRTGRVVELLEKDGQQLVAIDGMDTPFEPDEHGVLRPIAWLSFFKQAVTLFGNSATPAAIQLDDFGNVDDFVAVEPASDADVSSITGRYRSGSTGTDATISIVNGRAQLRTVGRFGSSEFSVDALGDTLWRVKCAGPMPWGGILTFEPGASAFRFTSQRTWSLRFERVE
jgi:CubicO group peptidase (beta-lactamase class C family)